MARPIESVEEELNLAFPNSSISLSQIEDRLIVRGQTPDTAEMSQIIQVLMGEDSSLAPQFKGNVVHRNMLQ